MAVSTGGLRIDSVNGDYRDNYDESDRRLAAIGISNPNPYADLWEWYGRWSSGDLPSYQSRRRFIAELYLHCLQEIRQRTLADPQFVPEPTGWPRVDRTVGEIRQRLATAVTEEQFQAIGLFCREVLISLGQAVYDPESHNSCDGVKPSPTDAKRMIEAYIASELSGSSNEAARKHVKAAYEFAVGLQHHRTASFRDAALCAEATTSVVNAIAIISGRRDPD